MSTKLCKIGKKCHNPNIYSDFSSLGDRTQSYSQRIIRKVCRNLATQRNGK